MSITEQNDIMFGKTQQSDIQKAENTLNQKSRKIRFGTPKNTQGEAMQFQS